MAENEKKKIDIAAQKSESKVVSDHFKDEKNKAKENGKNK